MPARGRGPDVEAPSRDASARTVLSDALRYLRQRSELGEPALFVPPDVAAPVAAARAASAPAASAPTPSASAANDLRGPLDDPARRAALAKLEAEVEACRKCTLYKTRTHPAFGVGSGRSGILFVGEAPGAEEDAQGEPFVGRAGQLLTRAIVQGMKLARDDVYIANILKDRPPGNRVPTVEEAEACLPFLVRQIALLSPRVICALGSTAARWLLGEKGSLASLRDREFFYHGIQVVVTYHPAAILRTPDYKRPFWEDLQKVMRLAGLPAGARPSA